MRLEALDTNEQRRALARFAIGRIRTGDGSRARNRRDDFVIR
jgi:hypothetical protein